MKDLILEDGQGVSQDLRNLIDLVLGEIESWINRGEGAMTFEAQIALSNMGITVPPKTIYPIKFHARYNKFIQLASRVLFNLQLELERKMFTSQLSLFTPKCDEQ